MTHEGCGPRCPHCDALLQALEMPEGTGWETGMQFACFNDDCDYYREGWQWMWNNYRARASYRFRILNPETGTTSPLPVWSETALRDRIVGEIVDAPEDREVTEDTKTCSPSAKQETTEDE